MAPVELSGADYARAERFLPWNVERLMFGLTVEPNWIRGGSECFWYRKRTRAGSEFLVVDCERASCQPGFDHRGLAASLGRVVAASVSATDLPFDSIEMSRPGGPVRFAFDGRTWAYDSDRDQLTSVTAAPGVPDGAVLSPDGRWMAFVRDFDLWVHEVATGRQRGLTDDGDADRGYAVPLASPLAEAALGPNPEPTIIWSPDSSRFLTFVLDRRGAPQLPFVQFVPGSGGLRPKVHWSPYPLPGDDRTPTARTVVADPSAGRAVIADHPPLPVLYYGSPVSTARCSWSRAGDRAYLVTVERGYRRYSLLEIDPPTGRTRTLVTEESETGVAPDGAGSSTSLGRSNLLALEGGSDVLWWSARDGWSHLYLYDAAKGALRHQVTTGAWVVDEVIHVDDDRRVLFTACGVEPGEDPYLTGLYRVSTIDGGAPQRLTSPDADHRVQLSPSGRFFLDTASRWDRPPTTTLRDADGRALLDVANADVTELYATGWQPPQRTRTRARDDSTDVYGLLFRPSTYDAQASYPILDFIYGGPQTNQAGPSFADSNRSSATGGVSSKFWHAQALAELGFVVVMIDGLGMPLRSRKYQDVAWRDLADGGIADHVAAYRQLAEHDGTVDLDRIGIFGHSAGGYASAHALLSRPDIYKVCVSSAGNHDHRLDKATWVERYMGLPVADHYRKQANSALAANLEGKLLLVHGDMDENVHLASTLTLVDALVEANKDFDLLILPNRSHAFGDDPYFTRVRWDYFVRHLLGAVPPYGYRIAPSNGNGTATGPG